jgi:putative addiction module component (TIGR02574 family)
MSTEELLAEALRLTRADRARVAEELLSSLEECDEEVATAWATELERRSREIAEGHVQTISWETARTEILKEIEQRRSASNCILRRVPSFAAPHCGTTSDAQDWATSSPRRFRSPSIEPPTPLHPARHGRARKLGAR